MPKMHIHTPHPISYISPSPPSSSTPSIPTSPSPLLRIPHILQLLDNQEIRVQKPIHTVLRTALLRLIQLPALDRARDAFRPADIGEVVHG